MNPQDSPLSITASIAGILTFVAAIAATIYVRITYLANADSEYFSVKTSLSWYKTESTFLHDLIRSADRPSQSHETRIEFEMYQFVMEQLGKLEERLLEVLTEAEESADRGLVKDGGGGGWTILPNGRTGIAISWLRVRTKALELVRQRDALGSRVLFAQMSMISSRVRDQETKSRKREEGQRERLERLEKMVFAQHEKLDKLEDLVYRIMHRDRVSLNDEVGETGESPIYDEERVPDQDHEPPSELQAAGQGNNHSRTSGPDRTKPYYSISSA